MTDKYPYLVLEILQDWITALSENADGSEIIVDPAFITRLQSLIEQGKIGSTKELAKSMGKPEMSAKISRIHFKGVFVNLNFL